MNRVPTEILEYLSEREGERGEALRAVFDTVLEAMPHGYEFDSFHNAPHWVIPLSTYPVTYNTEPLSYVGLMAQKQYNSLYLMGHSIDVDEAAAFRDAWTSSGLRLDMGKICLRFKTLTDVNLSLIAETVAAMTPERYIAFYERSRPA